MLDARSELIIAGTGGQGILLAGTLLAHTAMLEGKYVTWIPSYGAERRGGASYCLIIISNKEIFSPIITHPDCLICLDKIGLEMYENSLRKNGILFINTSLIKKKIDRTDIEIIEIPAGKLAEELGNIRTTNMISIGAYIEKTKVVSLDNAIKSLKYVVSKKHSELIELNALALNRGAEFIKGKGLSPDPSGARDCPCML